MKRFLMFGLTLALALSVSAWASAATDTVSLIQDTDADHSNTAALWNDTSAADNSIEITQSTTGADNEAAVTWDGNLNLVAVEQTSLGGLNSATLDLSGGSGGHIDVYQGAGAYNTLEIYQTGALNIVGDAANDMNNLIPAQLYQQAGDYNYAHVQQDFSESLTINQRSTTTYNEAQIYQSGGGNVATIQQEGALSNYAYVEQTAGGNLLKVRQITDDGSNSLYATQSGGFSVEVIQDRFSGNNVLTVTNNTCVPSC